MYTARDIILVFRHRGFSDAQIAKAIGSERATITKIRNQTDNYTGKIILKKLETLARLNNLDLSPRQQRAKPVQRRPAPARPSIFQRRCAACPFQPPAGLKPAEFYQWIKQHPCERQQRGGCI